MMTEITLYNQCCLELKTFLEQSARNEIMFVYFSWPKKHIKFHKRFITITCCPAIILDTDSEFNIL